MRSAELSCARSRRRISVRWLSAGAGRSVDQAPGRRRRSARHPRRMIASQRRPAALECRRPRRLWTHGLPMVLRMYLCVLWRTETAERRGRYSKVHDGTPNVENGPGSSPVVGSGHRSWALASEDARAASVSRAGRDPRGRVRRRRTYRRRRRAARRDRSGASGAASRRSRSPARAPRGRAAC